MMKLSTIGLAAALGVTLSSLSVWAFAPLPQQSGPQKAQTRTETTEEPTQTLATLVGLPGAEFTAGETVQMEARLGHPKIAAGRDTDSFVFVDLRAQADQVATTQAGVNLAIVLDRSRSMNGRRLDNALAAARGMIRRLRDGDTVSVVAYNTATDTLIPPTVIDPRTREDVMLGLRGIEARGHTCISCGIEAGMEQLARQSRISTQGGVSRMLLLSDGQANTGVRSVEGFRGIAERARTMNTSISSIGVDVEYNERIMFAVAQGSNGRHYFVERPSGLPRIFDEELQSLVRTVASGVEVEIALAPGVQVVEVFDRSFDRRGNAVSVPVGSLAAGDRKTVLMRVRMSRADSGRRPVADVALRYRDLVRDEAATFDGRLAAMVTDDARAVSPIDPLVEARVARAETVSALTEANELFAAGEVQAARESLAENRQRIRRRKTSSASRAPKRRQKDLDIDFEDQLGALDEAERAFEQAAQEQPAAPASSFSGRKATRQNVANADPFAQ